jgi:hypothetical protein
MKANEIYNGKARKLKERQNTYLLKHKLNVESEC